MSDMNQIPQAVDSASKFGAKLLEVVNTIMGNSPSVIKRKAKAKADEIKQIADIINAYDIPIKYIDET